MKKFIFLLFAIAVTVPSLQSQEYSLQTQETNPLELEFQRLAVRRFIFSNNINLSEFVPSEIVAFESMHPAFTVSENDKPTNDTTFRPQLKDGKLILDVSSGKSNACFYVGAVNPYATYDLDIESIQTGETETLEIGIDIARYGLRDRVQIIAKSGKENGFFLRVVQNVQIIKEQQFTKTLPECPFKLRVQLYGRTLGVFTEKNGATIYHGHLDETVSGGYHFGNVLDFRNMEVNKTCSFNIVSNLQGTTVIGGARSYLSAGMGQADIRVVSYEDLTPYMDDGRLWFTFSCRGIGIRQPSQGVMSVNPSVFDVRFEGMIAFDFGDGLLRNSVGAHLFYDRNAKEWRAYSCDFGGSKNREGRSESNLFAARSTKDPRRGYSVMKAKLIATDRLPAQTEDPCIFYDKDAKKWRLLVCAFTNTITANMFESDTWDGKFTQIVPPIGRNSTGTVIQKIGAAYYCLMGGAGENLRVHSYPDLKFLGFLNLDLQPHCPKPAGRIWAQVVPLPEGYPYRYVLLTMDRPNFTGIKGPTWSYGALYFYGANPKVNF
ncbi:MAG: hypothetical protein LBT05_02985 [Planctomycetaceae bacterium]|jgi:hypothetical protein|nr:hypothetical protein [Planctomycetaceae bacterium]